MAKRAGNREISCLSLTFFYAYLEARGQKRITLQHSLPYPPAHLDNRLEWIDYETFQTIERRMGELFADEPDVFFQVGRSVGDTRGFGFLAVLMRALTSPVQMYNRMPPITKRFLFPFLTIRFERRGPAQLRARYAFDEGFEPTDAFLETVRGILTGIPRMMGAPEATVRMRRESPLLAVFDIETSRQRTTLEALRSTGRNLVGLVRMRMKNLPEVARELEDANRLLQEKVDALTEAKEELAHKVAALRDLRDNLELRVRERTAELEEARGTLEDTVGRLEHSDRARRDFFTNVSHELKTPLTLILGPVEDLEASAADRLGGRARSELGLIRHNAQSLLRLVNEILDFARMDAGRISVRPESLDVRDFVRAIVTQLEPLAERREVTLVFEEPPETAVARFDPKLVRRALVNLIVNAIKYVDTGDRVTVRARIAGDVLLEVDDTGPGIPSDEQARVFERFQRVNDARGRVVEGSGIGLAMVRDIAQLHGGDVELDSEPGRGSAFRLRLPYEAGRMDEVLTGAADDDTDSLLAALAQPKGEPEDTAAEPTPTEDGQDTGDTPNRRLDRDGVWRPGGTVLLAEDNGQMRAFLTRLLSREYRVIPTADGVEALETAERELPDLVLSDVMMPRMHGYELCRRLKEGAKTRNIPVILITARHGTEAALEGFNAGADDYLVKPFSPPELMARVAAHLRIRTLTLTLLRTEKQAALGIMSSGVTHEIRNPLNVILNSMPVLKSSFDNLVEAADSPADTEVAKILLGAVSDAGERIRLVVDAFRTLARENGGTLELQETRLSRDIAAVLAILRYRQGDRVQVHVDYAWDEALVCYPTLVGQVVMNLVSNALDVLRERRGGNVWLRTERDGDEVRIRVRDDGPGIPVENRERVFTPFFTTKAPGAGTGLGLPVSREIMTLHGGTLALSPEGDGGSEFVATLPFISPDVDGPVGVGAAGAFGIGAPPPRIGRKQSP